MVGYVFLNMDKVLLYRTASYLEEDNPRFYSDNKHLFLRSWKFNTSVPSQMISVLKSFVDLELPPSTVQEFIKSIGFDMSTLKGSNVNTV